MNTSFFIHFFKTIEWTVGYRIFPAVMLADAKFHIPLAILGKIDGAMTLHTHGLLSPDTGSVGRLGLLLQVLQQPPGVRFALEIGKHPKTGGNDPLDDARDIVYRSISAGPWLAPLANSNGLAAEGMLILVGIQATMLGHVCFGVWHSRYSNESESVTH